MFSIQQDTFPLDIYINNVKINFTNEVLDLGIIFDNRLTFRPHILTIVKKLKIRPGIVLRNMYYLKCNRIKQIIFFNFILPIIDYGIIIWASAAPSNIKLVNNILEKAKSLLFKQIPVCPV